MEGDHHRLVEEVTGWAEREFPGELRSALLEFLGDRRAITEDEENWAAAWFLHDRELAGGGTPLERYASAGPDPQVRELAASHAGAKLRLWRVVESWPGERLLVEPYAGGRQIMVDSPNISANVARWDIVLGRLKPDSAEFWGAVRSYRASDEEDLRHLLAQTGAPSRARPGRVGRDRWPRTRRPVLLRAQTTGSGHDRGRPDRRRQCPLAGEA
ncbi:MAG: hypothetical protein ACXVHL_37390 [Solirubrobacteraceae bacterium]